MGVDERVRSEQLDIFELTLPRFKFEHRPIKLFEAFAGVGCQAMAMNKLGIDYETVGISEIDKHAIKSYMAIHGKTKNYGDISKMQEIPQCDIFTWSFPCTDLSKAGKRKGMTNDTRSGLVYEVLRLLKDSEHKPKVLIMENVPDLVQAKFARQWADIQYEIEELGYSNYTERLNAKNYGVAQNRDRVFMVSILGDWAYKFPQPIKLEKRLKDYLEDEVDEKYYLSEKKIKSISNWKAQQDPLKDIDKEKQISPCLTARGAGEEHSGMILISEATTKGYAEAQDGDGVYINRPHQKRGVVQKGMIQTIKTSGDDVGVVVKGNYSPSGHNASRIVDEKGLAPAVMENHGTVTATQLNNLRIRKLTPLECWRLMSIDDNDFYKAQKVSSNSQLYKQAGNGIVVDVFAKILENLF